jgi:hypothetical protein
LPKAPIDIVRLVGNVLEIDVDVQLRELGNRLTGASPRAFLEYTNTIVNPATRLIPSACEVLDFFLGRQ